MRRLLLWLALSGCGVLAAWCATGVYRQAAAADSARVHRWTAGARHDGWGGVGWAGLEDAFFWVVPAVTPFSSVRRVGMHANAHLNGGDPGPDLWCRWKKGPRFRRCFGRFRRVPFDFQGQWRVSHLSISPEYLTQMWPPGVGYGCCGHIGLRLVHIFCSLLSRGHTRHSHCQSMSG